MSLSGTDLSNMAKKNNLPWLRIEQHWPRELQIVFCRVCATHTHQTTPTVDHVLFVHAHRYYNSYKHKRLHDVCSLCIDQQTRGTCAL